MTTVTEMIELEMAAEEDTQFTRAINRISDRFKAARSEPDEQFAPFNSAY